MPFDATLSVCRSIIPPGARLLDYGAGSGDFLQSVGGVIGEGVGVELDLALVEEARGRNRFPHVSYLHADAKQSRLPFPDQSFDVVTAFGVLEHVGPEGAYIQEFHRLLRDEGRLIIEVPSKGPLRAFDVGNIKYNFPALHRWFYLYVARERAHYERTFGPDAPMFGQFTRDADQHKHYSEQEMARVAAPVFSMESHKRFGLFAELIQFLGVLALKTLGRTSAGFFNWLQQQDAKLVSPWGRANLIAVFRKA